jgi:hypothetical protein
MLLAFVLVLTCNKLFICPGPVERLEELPVGLPDISESILS